MTGFHLLILNLAFGAALFAFAKSDGNRDLPQTVQRAVAPTLKVMVIDTGVDGRNADLMRHIPAQYRTVYSTTDEHGHGTHVFGIIARAACPQVELIPCKAFVKTRSGKFDAGGSLACIRRALDLGVDIVNYSAGGTDFQAEEFGLIRDLAAKNVLFVAAAGNEGADYSLVKYYPATYDLPNIVAVGNLRAPGDVAKSSSRGSSKLVWEVGTDVKSALPGGTRGLMSGSSQAAAKHTARLVKFFCDVQAKAQGEAR